MRGFAPCMAEGSAQRLPLLPSITSWVIVVCQPEINTHYDTKTMDFKELSMEFNSN